MSRLTEKILKICHDAKATITAKAGRRLYYVKDHPKISEKLLIQEENETHYTNSFEKSYYGAVDEFNFYHPKAFFYVLKDVWVVGSEAHVFFSGNELLSVCSSLLGIEERKIRRPIPSLAKKISEPVFILASRAPGNRGHFLVEHLARLVASRNVLDKVDKCKYLVTAGHRKWQLPYLKKLGIPESDVIESSVGSTLCKTAYYVPTLCTGEIATVSMERYYRYLRDRFIHDVQPSGRSFPIFLTRKDAPDRRLSNEDAIFAIAKKFLPNIKPVALSRLSLNEQINIFQQAPFIIGPHSQSFRNILFTRNSVVVQLIQGFRDTSNNYYKWAQNYNYIGNIGKSMCLPLFSEIPFNTNSDWIYPEDKFEREMVGLMSLLNSENKPL